MIQKIRTLGMLGGGQLGRMSALAAANLGIATHIYCPEENCPASLMTSRFTRADYENQNALKAFADSVDVITYEFENIPLKTIDFLSKHRSVYPDAKILEISQNRLKEKAYLNEIGIPTAGWAAVYGPEDIARFMELKRATQSIIKTTRFGYDGKGQIKHHVKDNVLESWLKLKTDEAIIEEIIDFAYECSILVARDVFGRIETFPVTLNNHKSHILSESIFPAPVPEHIKGKAEAMAPRLADSVGLVGILALELFVTKDDNILANEIAPRPHNSGHWTMDGCNVSQFEQHVRAVCGLPLRKPMPHSAVTMVNLIGNDAEKVPAYLAMDNACVHLYGKSETRPGRKMGHVNVITPLKTIER
jgi:5-(carboxyamino)imidazole ribonucleotide synthase